MTTLKIDKDFRDLLPPLTDEEFAMLEKSILKEGIRENLLTWNGYIVDGHNRYEIAKYHKLDFQVTEMTFGNKQEVIQWMLNNQLGRRNLPKEKRVDIILQADELIKSLYEKGREKKTSTLKEGDKLPIGSTDPNGKPTHNTNEEIAKLANTSSATVKRMKKIKREDPELYKEVTEGKKTIATAYYELPTVKKPNTVEKQKEEEPKVEPVKKQEEPKEVRIEESKKKQSSNSQLYDFPNPTITDEEREKLMFGANVTTLFMHLSEIESFYSRTKDVEEVIYEAMKRDPASMKDYKEVLRRLIISMEDL